MRTNLVQYSVFIAGLSLVGCAADAQHEHVDPTTTEQGWDSQDGNPTHATHSYMTEYAADQLKGIYPELVTYRARLVDGANREIHDLVMKDAEQEALRHEFVGTNGGCEHPERVWNHVVASYHAGDHSKAFWYLGILMHYVEDMGVPAHALHVYHQSSPSNWDHFEVMATQGWYPSYSNINKSDPHLSNPSDYTAFSSNWTISDWQSMFPGVTYTRTYYSMSWWWASGREKTFMSNRQGRTATAVKWAMQSALSQLH